MKTPHDPRHQRRVRATKTLFSHGFHSDQPISSQLGQKVISDLASIDQVITKCAPEWPLGQINRLDLSVLRLAVWELIHKKKTPPKVIIDEAIELGKRYGSSSSGSFINGVLASALKQTGRLAEIEETDKPADKSKKTSKK